MTGPLIRLGYADKGTIPGNKEEFFKKFQPDINTLKLKFRGEADGEWREFKSIDGNFIAEFQRFLSSAGFHPNMNVDGIFGYRTQSAARLFQEYIRNVEKDDTIGTPDGLVGSKTWKHVGRWQSQGKKADWANRISGNPDPEYRKWMDLLHLLKAKYTANPHVLLKMVQNYQGQSDTLKVQDWDFSEDKIHIVGIRRKEWEKTGRRSNDDLIILLAKGLVFKFYGSTDPSQRMASRPDEPFLVLGQHRYRYGWHKMSDPRRIYRALKPAGRGVLVFRDIDHDDSLTPKDIEKGMTPNNSINVHWSGIGTSCWSAGCQVVSGKSYINHNNELINCSAYASPGYQGLGKLTRGAYNVVLDLVTVLENRGAFAANYFLMHENDLKHSNDFAGDYIEKTVERLRS